MLNKLVELSLKERLVVYFTIVLIAALGFFAFSQLPIEAYPDLVNTEVQIISQWPGRSAEEMEKFVTIPIETEMNGIPHLQSLRSISLFGLSALTLMFDESADDFYARAQVIEKLQGVALPDGVNPQLSPQSGPTGEIYRYILTGNGVPTMDLKTIEDWTLERQFKTVPGVADVVSFGGPSKQYVVEIDPQKLAYYGITLNQVVTSVANNNANAGGSLVEQGNQGFVLRGVGLLESVDDIGRVIVANRNGSPVTVEQIGIVKIGNAVRLGKVGWKNHDDVVEGIVLMRRGENASRVIKAVEEKVKELNSSILPKNVRIVPYYDRADLVNVTTHTVLHNLLEGMILVVIVLFVFLGNGRSAFIAALIVPLSLLFAFILMWFRGMSANLLSLGAIDFGVIIDAAVIMVEAIFARLALKNVEGESERFGVIKETALEVSKPIFFAVIIIIAAMLPIFSFQEIEGRMFSPLAFTLGFALLGAVAMSLTLVPALSVDLLKGNLREKSPIIDFLHRAYSKTLDFSLRHDRKILFTAIGLLLVSLYAASFLGSEFLPHLNEGALWVRGSMPMSISPTMADSMTSRIRRIIMNFPEVTNVVSQLGRPDDGTDATGFFNAEFFVDLISENDWKRNISKAELIRDMSDSLNAIPGIDFNFSQPISDNVEEAVTGVKGELAVKVFGPDLDTLEEKANEIDNILETVKGITDIGVFHEIGKPVLQVKVDRLKAARYGINISDIQELIDASIGGETATKFYEGEKQFDVVARLAPEYRNSVDKMGSMLVSAQSGLKIPLSQVADISLKPGAAFIYREENSRFIPVKFSVRGRDLGGAVVEAQQKVAKEVTLPDGYYTEWGGEFQNEQRAMSRLMIVVPLSLLLIAMLLYLAFDSWGYTFIILASIPFVIIGGVFGLLIAGLHFSISAGIGFIALFGVSVQDGVVLLSYVKKHRSEYSDTVELLKAAGENRLRPILMVALLAILGLTPAALSTGIGSETQKPLAIVIVAGLFVAAILNLIVRPVMFKMFTPQK
ncbi:MAG: CusA/CzcA family heavy metal efflux RND transporter [Candidatus Kryptoniota bacterium]